MNAPAQNYKMSLANIDDDEQVLAVVRRHPFGIVKLYIQVIVGLLGSAALIYVLLPGAFPPEDYGTLYTFIGIAAVVVGIVMLFIVAIATILYNMSQLVITDKTITQTIQVSLFNRKVSQLAVSSVEDVTANKNGFFPTIFNYGRLLIETAGEQENFHFDYCPHADHYAKLVLETRQQYMGGRELELREEASSTARSSAAAVSAAPRKATTVADKALNIGSIAADSMVDDQQN